MTMNFPALTEAQGKLTNARKALKGVFDEAGADYDMSKVKSVDGDSAAKVEWIRTKNDEIDALAKQVEGFEMVAKAAAGVKAAESEAEAKARGAESGDDRKGKRDTETKSFGEMFTDSAAFKGKKGSIGPEAHLDIELKTVMSTGAGWLPETIRTGKVVDYATRPIQIIDLIPANTTSQSAVVYMEETTFTNNAAETNESVQGTAGTYPESALALTEKNSPVRKIATWLPVTDEQLEDEPQVRGYVNNRLPFMLRQRLDGQALVGDGSAPNLRGFLNISGISTQAKGTDPTPDAVYKAMVTVQVTGRAMPNAVVMHPLDWQDVRLLRTADGIYIWGSPSESGPARIWGLPVAQSDAITQNTGLVLDTNYTELVTRRGVDVQISNSHSTFFVEGKQAIRADLRCALVVYRPAALCTVTGI